MTSASKAAQPCAQAVEVSLRLRRELVVGVADIGRPFGALGDAVEKISVGDPELSAVCGDKHAFLHDLNAAKVVCHVAGCELIMVARHEDDQQALASLSHRLLHDVVVRLRPVASAAQLSAVNGSPDEIQHFAVHVAQELQQLDRLTAGAVRTQIRYPDRTQLDPVFSFVLFHAEIRSTT